MARRSSKTDRIYRDITHKIQTGELTSHGKLIPEKELSDLYKVSNLTIRKALRRLSDNGTIISVPRVGNFVAQEKNANVSSNQVGIVMPFPRQHPYVIEVFYSFENMCTAEQLLPLFKNTGEDPSVERAQIEDLVAHGVTQIAVSPAAGEANVSLFEQLFESGVQVVFFDRWLSIEGIPRETIDFRELTRLMTNDLYELGCQKVAYVGRRHRQGFLSTEAEEEEGFLDIGEPALLRCIYQDELDDDARFGCETEYLLRRDVDGIVVGSETVLPGLSSALQKQDRRLDVDIAVAFHAVTPRLNEIAANFGISESRGYPLNERVHTMCRRVVDRLAEFRKSSSA